MSLESIVEKIRADGRAEAEALLAEGETKASQIVAEANAKAEGLRRETEADVKRRAERIAEHYAAAARLDVKKIRLAARRKAAENACAQAKARLLSLEKEDVLPLYSRLLETYAEEGDGVLFAENFPYAKEVALLPVFRRKNLSVIRSGESGGKKIDGGMYLIGKISDKDLTYDALLKADFEERQARIVEALFRQS